jgi:hypothetical protein
MDGKRRRVNVHVCTTEHFFANVVIICLTSKNFYCLMDSRPIPAWWILRGEIDLADSENDIESIDYFTAKHFHFLMDSKQIPIL